MSKQVYISADYAENDGDILIDIHIFLLIAHTILERK